MGSTHVEYCNCARFCNRKYRSARRTRRVQRDAGQKWWREWTCATSSGLDDVQPACRPRCACCESLAKPPWFLALRYRNHISAPAGWTTYISLWQPALHGSRALSIDNARALRPCLMSWTTSSPWQSSIIDRQCSSDNACLSIQLIRQGLVYRSSPSDKA